MNEGGSRRAVAEIRFGEDRIGITKVGGRSIHQYWTLLGPHFRDVLLAPQRRSDDGGVAWTWRETADQKPLTAAELAGVRKRLERAKESFEENPVSPLMGEGRTGTSSQALIDQVAAKVKSMTEALTAKPDAVLANFVCRTETGVMVHSWGVASAAPIIYPDSLETGVSGVVLVAGKPVKDYEVVIENAKGLSVARMQSDESGEFHFSKIGPGRYRVRVVSGKVKFPAKGVMVTVERGAVARLELRSDAESNGPEEVADEAAVSSTGTSPGALGSASSQDRDGRGWLWKAAGLLLILLLLAGGGVWAWRTWSTPDETDKPVALRSSSMAPEDFSAGQNSPGKARLVNSSSDESAGLGAAADGVGGAGHRTGLHSNGTDGRHAVAAAAGTMPSSSIIGSKIEVLSGAADESGADEKNTLDREGSSIAPSGAGAQDSVSDRANTGADVGAATGTAATSHKKKSGKAAAAPSTAGRTTKAGGVQPGEAEAVSVGNENLQPGAKANGSPVRIPAPKKAAARPPKDAVSVGEHPPEGEAAKDEVSSPGATPVEAPPDEVTVDKPDGVLPPATAPISRVSVVNKNPAAGRAPGEGDVSGNGSMAAAVSDASARAGKATKHSQSTPGIGAKATPGVAAGVDESSAGASREPNDTAQGTSESDLESEKTPAGTSEGKTNGFSSETELSSQKNELSSTAKTGEVAHSNRRSGVAKKATVGLPVAPKNKATANREQTLPGDEPEESLSDETSGDPSAANRARNVPTAVVSVPDMKTMTAEVRFARWEAHLLVDAIVPTLPVRVGAMDLANQTRDGLLAEKRARLPVTFRRPVARCGFAFELLAISTDTALFWQDSPEAGASLKIVDGARAEISWIGENPPCGSTHLLKFSDGHEAVRLMIAEDGGVVLKVAAGVRARALLIVKRSVADDTGQAKNELGPRFNWQVNGVTSPSKEIALNPILGNQDHRLSIPLDFAKESRAEIALADRSTGWALVTRIQLQPRP